MTKPPNLRSAKVCRWCDYVGHDSYLEIYRCCHPAHRMNQVDPTYYCDDFYDIEGMEQYEV